MKPKLLSLTIAMTPEELDEIIALLNSLYARSSQSLRVKTAEKIAALASLRKEIVTKC